MSTASVLERKIVRHVNPISVARIVFGIGLSVTAIVLVGLVSLYLLAVASGALRSIDSFITGWGISLNIGSILPAFGIALAVTASVLAVVGGVLAVLYNLLAELFGGVEVVTLERQR